MIKQLKDAKMIEVYHKGCYGCGTTAHLYDTLQKYLAEQIYSGKIDISDYKFRVKRIDYDMKWQDELKSADLEAPAVKITKEDGEIDWIAYKELEKKIKRIKKCHK